MRRDVESPEAYLADLDDIQAPIVKRIRKLIKKVAPGIGEKLQYGMLDYPGLANLGAQKRLSLSTSLPKYWRNTNPTSPM